MTTRTQARLVVTIRAMCLFGLPSLFRVFRGYFPRWTGLALFLFTLSTSAQPVSTNLSAGSNALPVAVVFTNNSRQFSITSFKIRGDPFLTSNSFAAVLERYTGTNVDLVKLVTAASDLERTYRSAGYSNVTITLAPEQITNGLVTMHVFRGARPQLLVDGKRVSEELVEINPQPATAVAASKSATNAVPRFYVRAYEIRGDTLLSTETLTGILAKYTGTNIAVQDILKAGNELQMEYRNRGFPTITVTIPPQKIDTNGIVKIRVFEGHLSNIEVVHNRFFSSNNVMRALPSLQRNLILSRPVFEAELDRANANQDRQIYPSLEPGPQENTTTLVLDVKDRFPLHAKIDYNNQSSPGTPEERINTSAVYNNLWQLEHSIGVQYSFSPNDYKTGSQWEFYDKPLVASMSGFYRMPLGNPQSISEQLAARPGNFGFSEATRRFELPPPSGTPELNLYASRFTEDTGLMTLSSRNVTSIPGVLSINQTDVQEDLTVNNAIGFRLSLPVREFAGIRSTFSAGFDYKDYNLTSSKTNLFTFSITTINPDGSTNPPVTSTVASPVPLTYNSVDYFPFSLRWDASRPDKYGQTAFGIGWSHNFTTDIFGDTEKRFQTIAGSTQADGLYHILTASLSRDQVLYKQWRMDLRADGQWASEPLISNEQFGIGGLAGARGYREGEVFGDTGWRVTCEPKTPPYPIGLVYGKNALTVRGSIFMDYAEAYLLDPQGREGNIPLWGTGFGGVASLGPWWQARLIFSWPLRSTSTTESGQPRFDFSLSAQF